MAYKICIVNKLDEEQTLIAEVMALGNAYVMAKSLTSIYDDGEFEIIIKYGRTVAYRINHDNDDAAKHYQACKKILNSRCSDISGFNYQFFRTYLSCVRRNDYSDIFNTEFYVNNGSTYCVFLEVFYEYRQTHGGELIGLIGG